MEFDSKYLDVKRYTITKEDIRLIRDDCEYSWEKVKENL